MWWQYSIWTRNKRNDWKTLVCFSKKTWEMIKLTLEIIYIYIYSNWAKCLNVLGYDANSLRLWHAGLKVSYETWNYLKLNEKGFQQKK